ncbi:MAG TPA: hypothetical protein V6D29_11200 [Leptolyngbyaceae cyanobacterium]
MPRVTVYNPKPGEIESLDAQIWDIDKNIPKLLPAAFYKDIPLQSLRAWCVRRAIYQIPTIELVDWLKNKIAGKRAIEVGSGNNGLCHYLGIQGTDNRCQQLPEVITLYEMAGQVPTNPADSIKTLDAVDAVKRYKPDIIVASWITQKKLVQGNGNQYGPEEEKIVDSGRVYIHIGNVDIHGDKRILSRPHQKIVAPGLVSRSAYPDLNCVYVWNDGT